MPIARRLSGEFIGTALLLATVVGSGIMGEKLAGGNVALALLGNTLPTGAILAVLILIFAPVSGAHFNPVVSIAAAFDGDLSKRDCALYIAAQISGAIVGVWTAHAMFDLPILQSATKLRSGLPQWIAEFVATFGLLLTIEGTRRYTVSAVAAAVGLYITAAYWFTASTSFANPAVTIARSLSDTFAGIAPSGVPAFVIAQCLGAVAAVTLSRMIFNPELSR